MNGDENLIISPPGWRRVAMYFPLANGYQILLTNQRRERRRASGSRRTKQRDFSRLRIKMATGLGSEMEESGDSTEDLLFRLARKEGRRRKRATSAVTSGLQDC